MTARTIVVCDSRLVLGDRCERQFEGSVYAAVRAGWSRVRLRRGASSGGGHLCPVCTRLRERELASTRGAK